MTATRNRRSLKRDLEESDESSSTDELIFRLEGGKRYAHTAACDYKILRASLKPDDKRLPFCACSQINKTTCWQSPNKNKVIVVIEHDLKEHILCILDSETLSECELDFVIQAGEQIAFRTIGSIPILLSGLALEEST